MMAITIIITSTPPATAAIRIMDFPFSSSGLSFLVVAPCGSSVAVFFSSKSVISTDPVVFGGAVVVVGGGVVVAAVVKTKAYSVWLRRIRRFIYRTRQT